MSDFFSKRARNTAGTVGVCLGAALSLGASPGFGATGSAQASSAARPASAVAVSADSVSALLSADTLPPDFNGDDPERVRDALSGHLNTANGAPSITNRVRNLLEHPIQSFRKSGQTSTRSAGERQPARTFLFVLPASYGVRYDSKRKLLSVNVSLASPEQPGAILLKQTVKGQSGRKLVIAPEAKAKGFVQTFDTIQLQTSDNTPTNVRGNVRGPTLGNARNGDFAIVLVCTLEPPYMTEDVEHSDPTEEEPTDITRRTSSLQGIVNEVWLIDRKDGAVVTKLLRLAR